MYADEPEAFEDKLAHLSPKTEPYWKRFWDAVLHCCWWCCCCFWFASDPYKRDSNTWAVTSANDHVARPAHLKISTSDKRAVGMQLHHYSSQHTIPALKLDTHEGSALLSMQKSRLCMLSTLLWRHNCMKWTSSCFSCKTLKLCPTTSTMISGKLSAFTHQRCGEVACPCAHHAAQACTSAVHMQATMISAPGDLVGYSQ